MSDKSLPYMWKSDGVARNFRYILMGFFAGAVPHLQQRGFNFGGVKSIPFVSCASGINSCDVSDMYLRLDVNKTAIYKWLQPRRKGLKANIMHSPIGGLY